MSKDVRIKDNVTPKINTMKSTCQSFEKELDDMQTKLNALGRTKVSINIETSPALSELKKVEKQLLKTDDAADKLNKGLNQSYDGCVKDLKNITSEAKNAEKALKTLNTTSSESKDSSGSGGSNGGGKIKSALGALDSSGAVDFITDAALQISGPHISSALGKEKGTLVNSSISGAVSGAAIGAIAGPLGAAVGAVVGGAVGYFKGKAEVFEEKDKSFKEYYSNLFDTVEQQRKESLANGTSIAAEREFSAATNIGLEISSGSLTTDALDSMAKSGIDVYDALSKLPECMGKTNDEIRDMVANGLIPGADAAQAISDNTYQGLVNQLDAAKDNLDSAKGEGYTETKKAGLQYQIDAYTGENSEELEEANRLMGVYQASLENKQSQLEADALTSVVSGKVAESYVGSGNEGALQQLIDEYKLAKEAYEAAQLSGDEKGMLAAEASMGNVVEAANAIGTNEYNASDEAKIETDRQKALLETIKNDSALQDEYWDAGYEMGVKLSEGLDSAGKNFSITVTSQTQESGGKKAFGLSYVPYNGYPATLHEGERILTASENRNYGGGAASVVISGNSFVIREEADIERVARALISKINQACTLSV